LNLPDEQDQLAMTRRNGLATTLILAGVMLLALALGLFFLARAEQRGQAIVVTGITSTPLPSAVPGEAPTIRLGPTAAAVATQLLPATPIPTGVSLATQPSAPMRIIIPMLGVDAPVVEVGWHVSQSGDARGEWETVAGAAGHHRGSAEPGQPGNCVLSAHSSDAGGAVFRGLETLSVGDLVRLVTFDKNEYTYQVGSVLMLDEVGATESEKREHARWLDPTDEAVLTLVTCWPPWSYTHRVVVRAGLED
jgi:sortase A